MASRTHLEPIPIHTLETLITVIVIAFGALSYPTPVQFQAICTAVVSGWLKGKHLYRNRNIMAGVLCQLERHASRRNEPHHESFCHWLGLVNAIAKAEEPPTLKPSNILAKIFGPDNYQIGPDCWLHCTGHDQRIALTGPRNRFILFDGVDEAREFTLGILDGLVKIEQDFLEPVREEPISLSYAEKAIEEIEDLFRFGVGGEQDG